MLTVYLRVVPDTLQFLFPAIPRSMVQHRSATILVSRPKFYPFRQDSCQGYKDIYATTKYSTLPRSSTYYLLSQETGEHRNVTTCVSKIQLFKERQKAAATSPSFLKKAAAQTRVMYVITNLVCHTHHWTYSLPSQRTLQCSRIAVLVFKLKLKHLLPPHKVATTKLLPQQ